MQNQLNEKVGRGAVIKLDNDSARRICRQYSEGLWEELKEYGLFIKGGTARNALLEYLGLPNETESRDIDICQIDGITDLDNVPATSHFKDINPKVEAVEYCYTMKDFMADSDFSINQVLLGHDGIYTTRRAILDIINKKLSPTLKDSGNTSVRTDIRALLFISRYNLEPSATLKANIKDLLSTNINIFSFQLLIALIKSAEIGAASNFVGTLNRFGLSGNFGQLFIKCLLLAWDFDLRGRQAAIAKELLRNGFDLDGLPKDDIDALVEDYPELYRILSQANNGNYKESAYLTFGNKVDEALGYLDIPAEKGDLVNYARVLKLNRIVQ